MFRIAIIGGGIGGLFAALSIKHHCEFNDIKIDIYEQAPEYREIGAGVGIGPNAAELVKKLGLLEDALKIAGDRHGIWLSFRRYDTGSEIHTIRTPTEGNTAQLPMHRAEFLDILVRAVESRRAATLHTNKHCQALEVLFITLILCIPHLWIVWFDSIADYKDIGPRRQDVSNIQRRNNGVGRPSNRRRWHPFSGTLALCGMDRPCLQTRSRTTLLTTGVE